MLVLIQSFVSYDKVDKNKGPAHLIRVFTSSETRQLVSLLKFLQVSAVFDTSVRI